MRANGGGRGGSIAGASFESLRKSEEWSDVGGGDSAAIGESDGDIGRADMLWKFRDGKQVEASGGEEGSLDGTAQFFDGTADDGKTVLRVVGQVSPSLIGEADLKIKIGHSGLDSGRAGTREELV